MLEQTDEHLHSTSTGQCFPQWSWIFLFCFINLQMDFHLLFQKLLPCPYSYCQRWIKQSQSHLILYLPNEHVLCKGLLHLESFSPCDVFFFFFFKLKTKKKFEFEGQYRQLTECENFCLPGKHKRQTMVKFWMEISAK